MTESSQPENRLGRWTALAILLSAILFLLFQWNLRLEQSGAEAIMFSDATVYIGGAESIAKARSYRLPFLETNPKVTIYPPLLSAYLSLWWPRNKDFLAVSGRLSAAMLFLTAVGIALGYRFARKESIPPLIAALAFAHLAATPAWFIHTIRFYSDGIFAILGIGLARTLPELATRDNWPRALAASIILALMYLTRTAAAAFLAAFALWICWKAIHLRAPKWLLPLLPIILAVAGWHWFCADGLAYDDLLKQNVASTGGPFHYALRQIPQCIHFFTLQPFLDAYAVYPFRTLLRFGSPGAILLQIFGALLVFCAFVGFRQKKSDRDNCAAAMIIAYLLQLGAWWFQINARTALVLLPWILVWSWKGASALAARAGQLRALTIAAPILLTANLLTSAYLTIRTAQTWRNDNAAAELQTVARFIREKIPSDSPIAISRTVPAYQLTEQTGRQFLGNVSSDLKFQMSIEVSAQQQSNKNARWVIYHATGSPELSTAIPPTLRLEPALQAGPWRVDQVVSVASQNR